MHNIHDKLFYLLVKIIIMSFKRKRQACFDDIDCVTNNIGSKYSRYEYHNLDPGTWILFFPLNSLDKEWVKAINLYINKELEGVTSIKCKTVAYGENNKPITFHCNDSFNREKILKIGRNILQKMKYNLQKQIYYKTDSQPNIELDVIGNPYNHLYSLNNM